MIIKHPADIRYEDMTGYKNVKKQILIGPADGSEEIVMRYFSVEPGGATPYHQHDFPHLVKIEKGQGVAIDADRREHPLSAGQLVYLHDNEIHGFKNTGSIPFDFICIVPRRGEA
ncbi:cupin domain-containing protein [candidate division KSB1 bacterium]|nr:cupin domain-containing protein [candidate division KSB1 bacterium]